MASLLGTIMSYIYFSTAAVATLLVSRVAIWFVKRLSYSLGERFKISPAMQRLMEDLLRLSIWIVASILVLVEALAFFGFGDIILTSVSESLAIHSTRIGIVIAIVLIAYFLTKFLGIFFSEFKLQTRLDPFTVGLAQSLTKYLIYAVAGILILTNALVAAGLSTIASSVVTLFTVFVGIAVSFAATGSLGNALAGIVLMSWRPYREGDRVEIGEGSYGDVLDLDIMFTKIKTIKNEIVHVPNLQVLGNKITNYSGMKKVLAHQQVTIGYDFDRMAVEQLLLKSAALTKNLLPDPPPFVLIRNLDNYYVTYEINAYTDKPSELILIYSDLMKNILDIFGKAHIEIMSPQQVAYRPSQDSRQLDTHSPWKP
jgi:small-conductance mechanosensitive channel